MEPIRQSDIGDLSVDAAAECDNEVATGVCAILKGELEPGERCSGRAVPILAPIHLALCFSRSARLRWSSWPWGFWESPSY